MNNDTELEATESTGDDGSVRPASKRSFVDAAKWSYVMDGGRQIITSAVTFILAKELGPEAFGVAAMALIYVMFIDMLQRQGLGAALIQRKDLRDRHLDSAFWAVLGVSVALTAASILLAGWWADVNDLPALRNVVIVLSFFIPIRGLVIVQEAVLLRDMDFRSLAIRTNVGSLTAGVLAVGLAMAGAGVWALVVQQLVNAGVGLVLLWGLSAWRPKFSFSRSAFKELLGFSSRSFLATIAVFVGQRGDTLMIGFFFGATAAGLYYFASRLVTVVTDLAARALQGTTLPELSRYQDDKAKFSERTAAIISTSALMAFPLLALVAGGSDDVIALIGTAEWGSASLVLRILAAVGAVRAVTLILGPALQALGRPGLLAWLAWLSAVASVATFALVGIWFSDAELADQVVALALARLGVNVLLLVMHAAPLGRLLEISVPSMLRSLFPSAFAATTGFFVILGVHELVLDLPVLARLAIEGTVAVTVMVSILWRFEPRARRLLIEVRRLLPSDSLLGLPKPGETKVT